MLFDNDLDPDIARGMKALEEAPAMGVPWPVDANADLALLRRIKEKHPAVSVGDTVEKFLVWGLDSLFWKDQKTVRWRSRLWTWVRNDERYRAGGRGSSNGTASNRSGRTHHVATEGRDGEATESLDQW